MPLAIVLKSRQGFSAHVLGRRYDSMSEAKRQLDKLREFNGSPMFHDRIIYEVVDTPRGTRVLDTIQQ